MQTTGLCRGGGLLHSSKSQGSQTEKYGAEHQALRRGSGLTSGDNWKPALPGREEIMKEGRKQKGIQLIYSSGSMVAKKSGWNSHNREGRETWLDRLPTNVSPSKTGVRGWFELGGCTGDLRVRSVGEVPNC